MRSCTNYIDSESTRSFFKPSFRELGHFSTRSGKTRVWNTLIALLKLIKSSHATLHRHPCTAPISQVKIPHYACTSSAQHECPIGPEQESLRQACCIFGYCSQFPLPNEGKGVQDCTEAASLRDRACKSRRGDNQFCKAKMPQLVAANLTWFHCRTRPQRIAICVSQLQTAGSTIQVLGMFKHACMLSCAL